MNWLKELKKYLWDDPVVRFLLIFFLGALFGSGLRFKYLPNLGISSLSDVFINMVILGLIAVTLSSLAIVRVMLRIRRDDKKEEMKTADM